MWQTKSLLARMAIRNTWMRYQEVYHPVTNTNGSMIVFFLVGASNASAIPWYIQEEAFMFKDMLFLRGVPSDKSIGKKYFFNKWVYHNLREAPLVSKIDGETFIMVPRFLKHLKTLGDTSMMYWGNGVPSTSDNFRCRTYLYPHTNKTVHWVRGLIVVWGSKVRDMLEEANVPDALASCNSHHSDVLFGVALHYANITTSPDVRVVYDNYLVFDTSVPVVTQECNQNWMKHLIVTHPQHARVNAAANFYALWHVYPPPTAELVVVLFLRF
eukprot:Filipodium_phascolosomae@DN762_c0_g1_i1.p1